MKESYSEDLASYTGPELYADDGNVVGVATTGVHAGQPWSSDITRLVRRRSAVIGRQHRVGRYGKTYWSTAESKTLACAETSNARTGISCYFPPCIHRDVVTRWNDRKTSQTVQPI